MENNTETIGEIYLIRNKENGKCYVGQAMKEIGKINRKWGTNGRWKSHLREAKNTEEKGQKDHCVLLNQAIRKYGKDAFEVSTLCECNTIEDMNIKENEYIQQYKSLVPHGYNLNYGGSRGKDSPETCEKKRLMRLGQTHDAETKKSISKGQLGNRRTTKKRSNPEDADLPKYIMAQRRKGILIGYVVNSFPVGTDTKQYITKSFSNKKNPEEALQNAKDFLEDLQEKYKDVSTEIEQKREAILDEQEKSKPKKTVERKARKDKAGSDKYDMPKYISLRKINGEEAGFEIGGLRIINDDGSVSEYRKSCQDPNKTMEEKLEIIKAHLEEVKRTKKCLIDEHILPINNQ
jgi:hypothetical protein